MVLAAGPARGEGRGKLVLGAALAAASGVCFSQARADYKQARTLPGPFQVLGRLQRTSSSGYRERAKIGDALGMGLALMAVSYTVGGVRAMVTPRGVVLAKRFR